MDASESIKALRAQARQVEEQRRWTRPADTVLHFLAVTLALLIAVYAGMLFERFQSPGIAFRHLISAPGCSATRAAGLAPAVYGQPGYWAHQDENHDGVACAQ